MRELWTRGESLFHKKYKINDNAWTMQEGTERFSKIRQKHNKDFVMGYAFNLCKNQILIVPCNYKFR